MFGLGKGDGNGANKERWRKNAKNRRGSRILLGKE